MILSHISLVKSLERIEYLDKYNQWEIKRHIVKPGITGWAQVNYPYGASIIDTTKKLSFDIYYISHFSILLDLLILFKTIKLVLNAKGSKPKI